MMQDDYYYYKAHQDAIVKDHLGDLVVIKDAQVVGYYKEYEEAFREAKKRNLAPGSFMLKQCKARGTDRVHFYNDGIRYRIAV
ncbi:hypothetical protein FACS1894141_3760 [Spirochaetia bacterium]|nr:hypothetical protein FACS1894141_3760 [Spirochaetia bacterium]